MPDNRARRMREIGRWASHAPTAPEASATPPKEKTPLNF